MNFAIEAENVSKTFTTKKRKLWYQKFTKNNDIEANVKIRNSNKFLFKTRIKETRALNNISLKVKKGEIQGLLGPNGAGKTTLAKIVSTLVLPDKGSVYINGYDVEKQTVMSRFSIGLVTGGERSLYWKLSPIQNLRFFGGLYGLTRTEANDRATKFLKEFGIYNKRNELVQNLSTGQKMKVAFIRALMHDPEVFILDEYNRGLDPKASKHLRNYIKNNLQHDQNKTILVMTHSMDIAEDLCNQITLIDQGKIVAQGSPSELKSSLNQKRIIEMETKLEFPKYVVDQLKAIGELEISNGSIYNVRLLIDNRPRNTYEVLDLLDKNQIEIDNLNLKNPNLEDVFIKYTGHDLSDESGE